MSARKPTRHQILKHSMLAQWRGVEDGPLVDLPAKALGDARFKKQGVSVDASGRVHARVVGLMFTWLPAEMRIPADTPVTLVRPTTGAGVARTWL